MWLVPLASSGIGVLTGFYVLQARMTAVRVLECYGSVGGLLMVY